MFCDDVSRPGGRRSEREPMAVDTGYRRHLAAAERANLPVVAVYRDRFLAVSETFVRDHLRGLRRYEPVVVTRDRVSDGLAVDDVPVIEAQARTRLSRRWVGMRARRGRYPLVATALRDSGARLVHAHFGQGGAIVRRPAGTLGLPMVVTFHGHDVTVDPAALSRHNRVNARYVRERSRLFQACAGIITVSQYLAGRLVEQGAAPDRVRVIPCGVDTRQFSVTPVPEQGPIVFVGRLVEKKGCADLLRAVSALDNPPETVVIGDGPLGGELQRLAEDLRIRVAFKGSQSSAAVRDALRRARVVVIPSKTAANGDQEGLPVVSLEAAAAARPVVASRHSGLGESVIHGRTGLLYREGDIAALRCALDSVLGDPARAQAYGTAGGAWVRERFDLAGAVRQVEEVYDMALGAARE